LSPAIKPLTCSVNGIGLVMDVLKLTLFPLSLPSKISVALPPSPITVPVRVSPAAFKVTVNLRSPRGVCMDTFQVPSVDIRCSSELSSGLEATQEQILLERRRLGKPFLPPIARSC
jgi:hypothetical protein